MNLQRISLSCAIVALAACAADDGRSPSSSDAASATPMSSSASVASPPAATSGDAQGGGDRSTKSTASVATLGDLIDRGARRLEADELRKLLVDAAVEGVPMSGSGRYRTVARSDGTFTGSFTNVGGFHTGIWGRWRIDEHGRLCGTTLHQGNNASETCSHYYELDGEHYAVVGEERTALASPRRFTR